MAAAIDETPSTTGGHRAHQACVASILDNVFGPLAKMDPRLWDRRAYHMLVGTLYQRLVAIEGTVSIDELVTLAKALAESRRAESGGRDRRPITEESLSPALRSSLPGEFGTIVRRIYGLQDFDAAGSPACESEIVETSPY